MSDLATTVESHTAVRPEVQAGVEKVDRHQRIAILGQIIAELYNGGDLPTAQEQFAEAAGDMDAGEIAAMEEEMIRGGLPVGEVQRLGDVHAGAFRPVLDGKADMTAPVGHPVHENDVVRYYSEGKEHIFPRTPATIGRMVQNCHPLKSVATVNRILASFRKGTQDVAEFWINMGGRFIQIRCFAVRDKGGNYRGCLEVAQDIGAIRALQSERRLLDWKHG